MSKDPREELGGWNLYAMCLNNAINNYDLLGMLIKYKNEKARKFIECLKKYLPASSKLKILIEIMETATDYTITIEVWEGLPCTMVNDWTDLIWTQGSTIHIGNSDTFTGKNDGNTYSYGEALAEELLHAWYQQKPKPLKSHGDRKFDADLETVQGEVNTDEIKCKCKCEVEEGTEIFV